jgi:hypothetical protein
LFCRKLKLSGKNNQEQGTMLVVKETNDDLFEFPFISILDICVSSIRPEARFLFERVKELKVDIFCRDFAVSSYPLKYESIDSIYSMIQSLDIGTARETTPISLSLTAAVTTLPCDEPGYEANHRQVFQSIKKLVGFELQHLHLEFDTTKFSSLLNGHLNASSFLDEDGDCEKFESLLSLTLTGLSVRQIYPRTFSQLKNLKEIQLEDLGIKEIPSDSVGGLNKLRNFQAY